MSQWYALSWAKEYRNQATNLHLVKVLYCPIGHREYIWRGQSPSFISGMLSWRSKSTETRKKEMDEMGEILPSLGWDLTNGQSVRLSDCQCLSHNSPGFDPIIFYHSGIWGKADEVMLNKLHEKNFQKVPLLETRQATSSYPFGTLSLMSKSTEIGIPVIIMTLWSQGLYVGHPTTIRSQWHAVP